MKKQVLVDMDGVLADIYSQFKKMEFDDLGIIQSSENLRGKLELDAFLNGGKYVRSKGFFRTVSVIDDSIKGLSYLNDKYNVLIVSSATEFPDSLIEKIEWLNEYFPFITWQQMIFCGKKDSIKGDIMIDDHPKNLDSFDGQTILFSQPHNELVNSNKHSRVNSWSEILKIL